MNQIIEGVTISEGRREIVDINLFIGAHHFDAPLFDCLG